MAGGGGDPLPAIRTHATPTIREMTSVPFVKQNKKPRKAAFLLIIFFGFLGVFRLLGFSVQPVSSDAVKPEHSCSR